jgi:hypothetical protein
MNWSEIADAADKVKQGAASVQRFLSISDRLFARVSLNVSSENGEQVPTIDADIFWKPDHNNSMFYLELKRLTVAELEKIAEVKRRITGFMAGENALPDADYVPPTTSGETLAQNVKAPQVGRNERIH